MKKRGGVAHDGWDGREPGDLAIFCPICPQVGINIPEPEHWQESEM